MRTPVKVLFGCAMVAVLESSAGWGDALKADERFAAAAAFYPGCFTIRPPGAASYDIMRTDIDRPLMVLMGGEDTETPPKDCQDKLGPLQAAGAPVEMHLYPAATHCWDCVSLDGFTKTDGRGNRVLYRYDAAVIFLDLASEMLAGASMEDVSTVLYLKTLKWAGYSEDLKVAELERMLLTRLHEGRQMAGI